MYTRRQIVTGVVLILLITIAALLFITSPPIPTTESSPIPDTRTLSVTDTPIAPDEINKTITFATGQNPTSITFPAMEAVYTEAFSRLGYDFELIYLPPSQRALEEANSGRVDGDSNRIYSLNKENEYPNLIRVDEPIRASVNAAYTTNPNLSFTDWEDFRYTDYSFVYIRGNKSIERKLAINAPQNQIVSADNFQQMVAMLVEGRVDVLINATEIESFIYSEENKDLNIIRAGYLNSENFYPYLNQKHSQLAPQLADMLRAMKEDGSYQQLFDMFAYKIIQENQ